MARQAQGLHAALTRPTELAIAAVPIFLLWNNAMKEQTAITPQDILRLQDNAKALTAKDVTIKKKAFLSYAVGSITNTSERRLSYLTVKLNLFDGNGNFVGSTSDAIQDCEPNQVWNFEAGILESEATSVVVSDIKGWLV
jgi:hypothetical protein